MAKWGWALHFSDSSHDMDYTDCDESPYDTEEEAYEAAEEASSNMHLGCGMMNAIDPDEHPERPEDIGPSDIEVFKI